jgi:uroporphyrinogen decarboxylase
LVQDGKQRVPLIGFSGSPWTLACYMIEGSGSSDFKHTKDMLYQRPDLMKKILDINIQSVADYLKAQVEAGAQALMIFDTWGGLLPDGWYQKTSLASMKAVINLLPKQKDGQRIPVLVFTKGGGIWLEDIADSGADVIGLDWTASVGKSRKRLLSNKTPLALQGNFDPLALFAKPEQIQAEAKRILDELAAAPSLGSELHSLDGHVFNLGHGISQFTNPEHVTALVEAVQSHSLALRN